MTEHRLSRREDIRTYVFGCDREAVFTLVSENTGNRFTYRARRHQKKRDFFFVDVLVRADIASDYVFIGFIQKRLDGHWKFSDSRTAALGRGHPAVTALDWFIIRISYDLPLDLKKIAFYHSGSCSSCGRPLDVPASLGRGMGPKCYEKAQTRF